MTMKAIFLSAVAAVTLSAGMAAAQPNWVPPGNDPNGYYSGTDHNGYYDSNGNYRRIRNDRPRDDYAPPPPPPAPSAYYEQGRYEQNCRRGNNAAGTIFGALAGGLLGSAASHGNGGAVVGGAILGGLLGNAVTRDIDCDDQPVAFRVYADGLNGEIGRRYDWRGSRGYGYFTPTREYRRGTTVCREWSETTYRGGQSFSRSGTACRQNDGNWRFD